MSGTKRLTIGLAVFDDYDGLYFTVQALRMYHAEVIDQCEILIVDNNPSSASGKETARFAERTDARYETFTDWQGTTVKEQVFRHASAEHVLCMDCHVFLIPGALQSLIDFFAFTPNCPHLVHGPLLYDTLDLAATHMDLTWRGEMHGIWARRDDEATLADLGREPFAIPAHGMGVFACRREAWPGFNPAFRGFGGEEGYIHEKIRQQGGKVICLPQLAWMHRFHRPQGVPYPISTKDKFRNYIIGYHELGLSLQPVIEHFSEKISQSDMDAILTEAQCPVPKPAPSEKYCLL